MLHHTIFRLLPSTGEGKRRRTQANVFDYPWIPAFAGMTDGWTQRVLAAGKRDRPSGPGTKA
jgi:hypothetical protein